MATTDPSSGQQGVVLTPPEAVAQFLKASVNSNKPMYFNGFGVSGTATDITVILQNGAIFVAQIQASFSAMKSLATALNTIVEQNERALGITYPTLPDAIRKMAEIKKNSNDKGMTS